MRRRRFLAGSTALAGATMASSGKTRMMTRHPGYFLPDESAPHERTFMQWPASRRVYDDPVFLELVQGQIATIANSIAQFEPVVMMLDESQMRLAQRRLTDRVNLLAIPTDDLWCRDSGPVFVKNRRGQLAICDLHFNGWGDKQFHRNDGQIARRVSDWLGLPLVDSGLVGELGGVESDGEETLIAHESSWVNSNRNKLNRDEIGNRLKTALGAKKILWAPGLKGLDITDFHIDSLARFVTPGELVIQLPEHASSNDPWEKASFNTYDILRNAKDAKGRDLNITIIPEPRAPRIKSRDFVASYVNYYVCNGAVIMAEFGDRETDQAAKSVLRSAYPEREIVALNVDTIGEVGGGIHCATQQQPKT